MADPYRYFRIEAAELTEALQSGLLELERGGDVASALAAVLRHAHTLKGAARVVKHEASAALAHALEDLLVPVREQTTPLSAELVSQALVLVDSLRELVRRLDAPSEQHVPLASEPAPTPRLAGEKDTEEPRRAAAASREELDRLRGGAATLSGELGRVRAALAHLARARVRARGTTKLRVVEPGVVGQTALTRVDPGEEAWLDEVVQAERVLHSYIEVVAREMRELREAIERLRLVDVEGLRSSLARTIRDAAMSANKRVRFEFHGGGLRVDPELYAMAARGLLQAVKNAVAHGIEPPAGREKLGKPVEGRVKVTVIRDGQNIRFSCEDDGRGLDLEALRAVLQSRQGASAARPTDDALIEELLNGGVSTAPDVTPIAGRGIGLDLIREGARKLGGRLHLSHRPGQGVVLDLEAKSSLAAFPALLVEASDAVYAIPIDAVAETLRSVTVPNAGRPLLASSKVGEAAQELAVFWPLSALLEPGTQTPATRAAWTIVLLRGPSGALALGVDRLLGTETIVAEALPDGTPSRAPLAGIARDGDGTPRFLLDPTGLHAAAIGSAPLETRSRRPLPILVIDDSLTTRMLERSILESAGYEVELATSAEEGLEMARVKRYSLFLVDVEMPGMDGFSFIETIMADAVLRAIPAVLVTSRNSADDLARGVSVGARAHVVKSEFDQVGLLELISKLVSET